MTIYSSTATFTAADAAVETESISLTVLAAAAPGTGAGRLEHPMFGAYDYPTPPTEWRNIDQDVIIAPTWAHTQTLDSGADVLWTGNMRDVECVERWTGEVACTLDHLRMLLAYWTNPPDPDVGTVIWRPSYLNDLGYEVAITSVTVAGNQVTLDFLTRQGYVAGEVEITYRVLGYAD